MSLAKPFVNPPRLPSPFKGRIHARSASRSPTRRQARDIIDPLLRDLSPTTTLRAFVADPRESSSATAANKADLLSRSINTLSASERALGAQAAQTCLDLRTWTRELESWHWPDTFDVPEPARKKLRMSTMTFNSVVSNDKIATVLVGDDEEEYWGSLTASTVQAYERRADEIGQALDRIDVEELKDYVLASHYRVDSRPSSRDDSIASIESSTEVKHLDDFTALVTATILQALPYLSRLNRLLDIWSTRLTILRQTPKYLLDLKQARTDLDHGWAAIAVSSTSLQEPQHARFDGQVMLEMKSVIENQVISLGRRLDRFLDRLEGRDDTVPEIWIDEFELLESAYGDWVVQAEQKVLQIEWRTTVGSNRYDTSPSSSSQANGISYGNDETLDHRKDTSSDSPLETTLPEPTVEFATAQTIAMEPMPPEVPPGGLTSHPVSDSGEYLRGRTQSPPAEAAESGVGQLAKRRAAFLNDIERTNSLKPTKTPVRSFEHASNAFTRLFRKDRSPEHARPKRTASGKLSAPSSSKDRSASGERNRLPSLSPSVSRGSIDNAFSAALLSVTSPRLMQSISEPNGLLDMQVSTQNSNSQPLSRPPAYSAQCNQEAHVQGHVSQDTQPTLATYQPTGLSMPGEAAEQPAFPENWPLTSPIEGPIDSRGPAQRSSSVPMMTTNTLASESEIFTPVLALQTDAFDRMFVQSLPAGDTERRSTAQVPQRPSPSLWAVERRRTASLSRAAHRQLPQSGDTISYLGMVSVHKPKGTSTFSHKSNKRAAKEPGSPGKPPVSTALHAGDFLRDTSQLQSAERPLPILQSPKINGAKRASVASIEAFPRSELKTIDVQRLSRQNSITPKVTPPETPPRSRTPSDAAGARDMDHVTNGAMSYKGMVSFPSPPTAHPGLATPSLQSASFRYVEEASTLQSDNAQGSPTSHDAEASSAPLNAIVRKRRDNFVPQDENQVPLQSPASSPTQRRHSPESSEDSFDRHVSEVLEKLPAQIKFKSRPGAVTPASNARGACGPRPKNMRVPPKQGAITIAPAEASPRKQNSANDPEVKLYHLTQAGGEDPIKLFVRLVGEGERVMVRVGGGWADLADYLRQYAEHHGSRTVSEGGLEVQTMSSTPLARKVSGPADPGRAKTPLTPLTRANATPRPSSKDSNHDWPSYSQPTFSSTNGRSTPVHEGGRQTPGLSTQNSTPKSTSTGSSRPSTANVSRPPSRQSTGEAVGLAGVSSGKKAGLPDHKAKWVEGMIERAKKASAEKSKEEREKHFNELGKAGSTRRVIFKSG